MNIALIIAGGSGKRTNQDIPKQFLNVYDKPIVIYTLERFQNNKEIDDIAVVCLEGWEKVLDTYSKQFGIAKLKWIIKGGESVQESIKNGVFYLKDFYSDDDIIIIHDGIRPMVEDSIISDCIEKCRVYGNGITSLPINEQIFKVEDEISTKEYIKRETIRCLQTPQAYKLFKIFDAYKKAFENNIGILGSSYANTMMVDLGERLYFAKGSSKNIKITTTEDIEIFKALLTAKKDEWLK
jgi:2-C-methyl-D-erythritol 4-phosphate cytidylyltransferase